MLNFDASEFRAIDRALGNLPGEIRAKVMARALGRISQMARTKAIKRAAERVDIRQTHVRERTALAFNAGRATIDVIVRSGWLPLYHLGATQTASGVTVKLRGSYKSAFLATMKSGHSGVMKRQGTERLPIRELFGPNPASDIKNHEQIYLDALQELIETHLLPRVKHEIFRALPK